MIFNEDELKAIKFNHTVDVQMRFNDIDPYMHVNNAVQIQYFDLGKVKYMEALGFDFPEENGNAMLVVNINVDFMEQIVMDEPIIVKTKIYEIGHKSVKMLQILQNKETGHIKTLCHCVMCGYNTNSKQAIVITDKWKSMIHEYEKE